MAAGYVRSWVMDVVVWVEEIVFIKSKGTRMPRIRRIRTDLGFCFSFLIEQEKRINRIRVIRVPYRLPLFIL